jgi:hypothetical protein
MGSCRGSRAAGFESSMAAPSCIRAAGVDNLDNLLKSAAPRHFCRRGIFSRRISLMINFGSTSAAGRALAKSSFVHSGFSSSGARGRTTRLFCHPMLPLVCLPCREKQGPSRILAVAENSMPQKGLRRAWFGIMVSMVCLRRHRNAVIQW